MATYTYADDADGTGATLTIAAGGATDTYITYTQRFTGGLGGSGTWVQSGTRTGDGTIALVLSNGHYLAYTTQTVGAAVTVSSVAYFITTASASSTHYLWLEYVQARIIAAALSGVTAANVIIRKLPTTRGIDDETYSYPAVVCSPLGIENQSATKGTNNSDDVGFPVLVSILAADNQDLVTNMNKYLLWREQINKAHRSQQFSIGSGVVVYRADVEPGPIVSPTAFWQNQYHSSLLIRGFTREGRGL